MSRDSSLILLYVFLLVTLAFFLFPLMRSPLFWVTMVGNAVLLHLILFRPRMLVEARPPRHWWGQSWRPWWKYQGGVFMREHQPVPGNPLGNPVLPHAPKPYIVNTSVH